MRSFNSVKNISKIGLFLTFIIALASCGGQQNDLDQSAANDTGAVAFKILFEHPENADFTIQSLDTCSDVEWVKASIIDENGTILKDGETGHVEKGVER